ncbi:MAG: PKD domain-containing protein [Bacteroidota bacterium]|nr:PKD domain-containing protein [Bacteroidota bacterium]
MQYRSSVSLILLLCVVPFLRGIANAAPAKFLLGEKPIAAFSVNAQTQCISGNSFQFSNNSQSACGCLKYQWSFGDGTTSLELSPTKMYTSAGEYKVTLLVTDDLSQQDSASMIVQVTAAPVTDFTINPTSSQCFNGANTFLFTNTSHAGVGGIKYTWDLGNGNSSTDVNPTAVYPNPGTYTVKLTAYAVQNACSAVVSKTLQVNAVPVVDFSFAIDANDTHKVSFSNHSTINNGSVNYVWLFGDTHSSTDQNPTNVYAKNGVYQVKLLVSSNEHGCTDSIVKPVLIGNGPSVGFGVNGKYTQCLTGNHFDFSNYSVPANGNGFSYNWDFGDGTVSSAANPQKVYTQAGSYVVKLIATDNNGIKDSAQANIVVLASPQVIFTINPGTSKCLSADNSFTLLNQSVIPTNQQVIYQWDLGNGKMSNQANPAPVYNSAGTYTIVLNAVFQNGCTSSATQQVQLFATPTAAFTYGADRSDYHNIQFENASNGNGSLTYQWDFGDQQSSSATNPLHTYTDAGTYGVQLKVISEEHGCSAIANHSISVNDSLFAKIDINSICQCAGGNNSFNFINESGGGIGPYTYLWDFGDGSSSTIESPSKKYSQSGDYNVKLTVSDAHGKQAYASTLVKVYAKPQAAFTATVSGDTVFISNTSSITTGGLKYKWQFDDGSVSSDTNPVKVFTSLGEHGITLIAIGDLGCADTLSKTITIGYTGSGNCIVTAGFTMNDSSQCVTDNLFVFTNTSTACSCGLTYLWDFGDGTTSSEKNPVKQYSQFGEYDINLYVTDCNGNKGMYTRQVYIGDKPHAAFNVLYPTLNGNSYTFLSTSTVTLGPISYHWDLGDGTTASVSNPTVTYPAGNYQVQLIVKGRGTCADTAMQQIMVKQQPVADFAITSSNTCLKSNSFYFHNQSLYSGTAQYLWDFGDGTTSTESNPVKVYTASGNFLVQLKLTDSVGVAIVSKYVTVYASPSASFNTIQNVLNGTSGSYTFISTATITSGSMSYNWSFGDGTSDQTINPTKVFSLPGTYSVVLIVSSNHGCMDTAGKTITIPTPASPLHASFTFSRSGCSTTAEYFSFTNLSSGGIPALKYNWDFGDGTTSSSTNPVKFYLYPNTYNITLTVTDSLGNVASQTVTVQSLGGAMPVASFNVTQNTLNGSSYTFISTSTISSGWMTYAWDLGNGASSTLINPTITYTNIGNYPVKLVVTGSSGCKDSITQIINVNTISNNSILINVSLAPNPARDNVTVRFASALAGDYYIKMMNVSGQVLYEAKLNAAVPGSILTQAINITSFPPGSYFIAVNSQQNSKVSLIPLLKN